MWTYARGSDLQVSGMSYLPNRKVSTIVVNYFSIPCTIKFLGKFFPFQGCYNLKKCLEFQFCLEKSGECLEFWKILILCLEFWFLDYQRKWLPKYHLIHWKANFKNIFFPVLIYILNLLLRSRVVRVIKSLKTLAR